MAKSIKQAFKLPVSLANDANAAALGEMLFGAAKGMKNFVTLTMGTGLGSGLIVDGELVIGEHGTVLGPVALAWTELEPTPVI